MKAERRENRTGEGSLTLQPRFGYSAALRQITASKRESFESDEVSKSTEIDVKAANSTFVPTYEILVQEKRFGDSLLSLDSNSAKH